MSGSVEQRSHVLVELVQVWGIYYNSQWVEHSGVSSQTGTLIVRSLLVCTVVSPWQFVL